MIALKHLRLQDMFEITLDQIFTVYPDPFPTTPDWTAPMKTNDQRPTETNRRNEYTRDVENVGNAEFCFPKEIQDMVELRWDEIGEE